jgi:hypothetical protein
MYKEILCIRAYPLEALAIQHQNPSHMAHSIKVYDYALFSDMMFCVFENTRAKLDPQNFSANIVVFDSQIPTTRSKEF